MKEQIISQIDEIKSGFDQEKGAAKDLAAAQSLKVKYLGKKGLVTGILKNLGSLTKEERPIIGQKINELKTYIDEECKSILSGAETKKEEAGLLAACVDITLPPRRIAPGKIHPVTRTMNKLIDVFTGMGFSVYEGPEVETDYYNFEALNFPPDHPARDMQDTFLLEGDRVLRTHTSPVQVRVMEQSKPPIFMIGPGSVYRRDTPDLTHSPIFSQVEGLMVDTRITFGDLKGVLTEFIHNVFGKGTNVRFRPSFFPFTEPSAEMEIECVNCKGAGCRVCKDTGWIEILGCGMVDPNVFESVGYPKGEYTGFAFGMGVERIAMLTHGINDIRSFYENNLKFLDQF